MCIAPWCHAKELQAMKDLKQWCLECFILQDDVKHLTIRKQLRNIVQAATALYASLMSFIERAI